MNNIKYENFKNICRMCMLDCCIKFTKDALIIDMFHKLTGIHFETNDELPQQICLKCFDFLNEIHSFSMTCKRTHSALMKSLNNYKNKGIQDEPETTEQIKIEDEITFEEHIIDFVKVELENDCETNNPLNEDVKNSTSKLITPISTNIQTENDEKTTKDLNNETNSSATSIISPSNNIKPKDEQNKCEHPSVPEISNNVKIHKRTQSGVHPYKCDQCEKSFTRSHNLTNHKRVHSGVRPYKCDQCDKSFIQSTHLKIHKRVHSGERLYKCNLCEKSFTQSNDLIRHKRVHIGARLFRCDQCDKSYTRSDNLHIHQRVHSRE